MSQTKQVLVVDLNQSPQFQRLLTGPPQTYGMKSGRVYLKVGEDCGQHSTEQREEMLVFLSGQGLLLIGEKDRLQVGEGKVSYIPPNTVHNVKNTGSKPLVYIYCLAAAKGQLGENQQSC